MRVRSYLKSYHCAACRWNGPLEPADAGAAAPCPRCGVYLYPLTWPQTWGLALAMCLGCLAFVVAAAYAMNQ